MKHLLIVFLIPLLNVFCQSPDTIKVKLHKEKGFGPFPKSGGMLSNMSDDNCWKNAISEIGGKPKGIDKYLFAMDYADFFQHTYQSYYSNKISDCNYENLKKAWKWEPDSLLYTKKSIRVGIAFFAYYDSEGLIRYKIDNNNNYDFRDDPWRILPPKEEKELENDSLLNEVKYQYYNGKSVEEGRTWVYVNHLRFDVKFGLNNDVPTLFYGYAEHYIGEVSLGDTKYSVALKGSRLVIRDEYSVKVREANPNNWEHGSDKGVLENELVKLGNDYYYVRHFEMKENILTLVKGKDLEKTGGTIVGLKAPQFAATSITGEKIELRALRGNYVLLDFWGSWCAPCREEIPRLKKIYEEYKEKNFKIIGIAKDNMENLEKCIASMGIEWPQIVQDSDMSIISAYNVKAFPTLFLLDEEGKIIGKGLRGERLSEKLEDIFGDGID